MRRLFLSVLIVLPSLLHGTVLPGEPPCPTSLRFAIGSYTNLSWLPTVSGAGLTLADLSQTHATTTAVVPPEEVGVNPTYCALSQFHVLYCATGGAESALTRLPKIRLLPHELVRQSLQASGGANHVAVLPVRSASGGDRVLVADYSGKLLSFVARGVDVLLWDFNEFEVPKQLASRATPRQLSPHPHQALPLGNGDVLVPDLGSDAVLWFGIGTHGEIYWKGLVRMEDGDGPRHAAQHPTLKDVVYLLNELSLTVVRLRIGGCDGVMRKHKGAFVKCERKQLLNTAAPGATAAAIRVSADGRFLYASVRYAGMTSTGSIVGFKVEADGSIGERIGIWSAQGVHPRDFIIVERFGGGDGSCKSYLGIVNRDSNHLVFVPRDVKTGVLADSVRFRLTVNTPTSVLMV